LEREAELGLLTELLGGVGELGGQVVLIRGEAGIGKSALVRAFVESAADSAHIHVGFCDDLQTPQPFGPFWDMARDEPALRRALKESDRQAVLETLVDLLSMSLRPTVMVIEDTQWSDEATLDAVKYVGRRTARAHGLLLLTYRVGEVDVDHPLRTVIGDLPPESVTRIELAGLSRSAVSEIIRGTDLDADRVLEVTHGNPFLVTEMASTESGEVPGSVRDSVMARVGRLSVEAREVLKVMSVVPERIPLDEYQSISDGSAGQLAECERLDLLEVGVDTVSFKHELIRRAVEASLTISESTAIHRALLERLPAGTSPARLVHHARCAKDVPRLIEYAPKAARAASEVGSHREASAHYQALGPYLDHMGALDRAGVLFDWARVEYYLGNVDSIEILDRAIGLLREVGADTDLARALVLGVELNRTHGRFDSANASAVEAIQILEGGEPGAGLAHALAACAWLQIHRGLIREAEANADRAIVIADSTDAELAMLVALGVKGTLLYVRGEAGGLDFMEELRRHAERGGHRHEEVSALLRMAVVALEIRDLARASDFALQSRNTAVRYELPTLETVATAVYAEARFWAGAWVEAEDLATETFGLRSNVDVRLAAALGAVRTRTGHAGSEEFLERAWALAGESGEIDHLLFSAAVLAERMWLDSRSDADLIDQFRDLVEQGIRFEYPWPAGSLALWLWMLGALEEIPKGLPVPYRDLFDGRIASAAEFWESRDIPYERALALICGDVSQRLQALEILESLGASAVASKMRRELRADGVSLRRGRGKATRSSRAGLTGRQAEVLELLDEGLSNAQIADRLFVSTRTVENHVSALLAKLDSTTRSEAVDKARSEGLLTG
jgi:DNA-binding CsgD family transcriptional regulator/type II secretory pathway predicted ATPase ExeA